MSEAIQFHRLLEPHEMSAETNVGVYQLNVSNILLGYLYVDPGSYSIAWKSRLNFRNVEKEALAFLTHQIQGEKRFLIHFNKPTYQITASLIISNGSDELVTFRFDEPAQFNQYQGIIGEPSKVSFARYDFHVQVSKFVFDCAFTAENPLRNNGELAIQLPRALPLSEETLRWIIERHAETESLIHRVDLESSITILSRLISSRSGSGSGSGSSSSSSSQVSFT